MILQSLNDEQKRAVLKKGHVLITACPGSGKTRVIIHKLAHELSQFDEKEKKRVVALTFTVRASEEIWRRLNDLGIKSNNIWTGTLHAFCYEWIIRPYSCYLPELISGYTIADETYCSDLIAFLKDKYGLKQIDPINLRFNRDGSFVEKKSIQKEVLKEFHQRLREEGLIDFELLLYYSYKILLAFPKIQKTLSNLFKLICVDEYQDTQDLLYAIISLIIKTGNGKTSLFMVGDTDQAIYRSLGGVAKTLAEIQAEIGDILITPLSLSGNYRSSQKIIDFYSYFQTQPIKIDAVSEWAQKNSTVSWNNSIDHKSIVPEIGRLINLSLEEGVPENEICVLVPQWWLITSISKKLRAYLQNVNFDASGLTPMSRNRENIWYKLSRLFLTEPNPKFYASRYRWAAELISNFEEKTNTEFNENYNSERNILKLINSITSSETEGKEYLNDCFDKFLAAINVQFDKYPILVENRNQYFKIIDQRLSDPDFKIPSDIESFKSFYRERNGVVINTCVGIKGEEFETVIAFGLLNGYIPHWNEIYSGNATDAANKLLYVICSRAKRKLHLLSELGRETKRGTPLEITPKMEEYEFEYDDI
jgi:superfamily I DNA/RNA helicase